MTANISGAVRTGGVATEAVVRAKRVPVTSTEEAVIESGIGPDGRYSIDVPVGRYVVGVGQRYSGTIFEYSAAGLRYGGAPPDTVFVDSQHPASIDFDLAALDVRVTLPLSVDGGTGFARLYRDDPDSNGVFISQWSLGSESGTIEHGSLRISFVGLLPGRYQVQIDIHSGRPYYDTEHFWIPGVRSRLDSPWVEVGANQRIEISGSVRSAPARIQGRITGAWKEMGFDPPQLSVVSPESTIVRDSRTVGRDGEFDLTVMTAGPVKLLVEHAGVNHWIGGRGFDDATVFQLEPGHTISGIEFVESALRIDVQPGNHGFNGGWFRLYDFDTRTLASAVYIGSRSSLLLGIPNLREGTYLLRIEADRTGSETWAPQWFDRGASPESATPIRIHQAGDVVSIALHLEKGGTITGRVREAENVHPGYFVCLTQSDDPAEWARVFAFGANNLFRFTGLPDGDWKVGARSLRSDQIIWFPGTSQWDEAGIVSTRNFNAVTGIEIVMPAPHPQP